MNMVNSNKLHGLFEVDNTFENENWIKTSIRTFAFGKNRNNSDITKESMSEFSKASRTIGGIPIVARYNEDNDDLEGHNVELRENRDGEYEFYYDTTPLGFTSPTASFYFEEVDEGTDGNADIKTYITVNDVYLWKRFDATKKILDWRNQGVKAKVSMEIDNVSGEFEDGTFVINDFTFSAITALGSDLEPCFKMAEIQLYTADEFKSDFKQLMYELTTQKVVDKDSQFKISKEGGTEMENENLIDVQEDVKEVEFEEVLETEVIVNEDNDVEKVFSTEENLAESISFINDAIARMKTVIDEDKNGGASKGSVDNLADSIDRLNDAVDRIKTVIDEEKRDDNMTLNHSVESVVEVEKIVEVEKVDSELVEKYEKLSTDFESLKVELAELTSYKRETLEKELMEQFEGQLTHDEMKAVFTTSNEKAISEIEKEFYALLGKKNFSLTAKDELPSKVGVHVEEPKVFENKYSSILEKHLKK